MKLIISGGGSGADTKEQDELFAKMLDKTKPLLYLPLAIDQTKHSPSDCLEWIRSTFDDLEITNYQMITNWEKAGEIAKKNPEDYAGIYIGGGNTPYLLKKLHESGFWEFIQKALEEDVPIMGGSAGAVIFAKTIIPALYHDMNWVELKEFEGLNTINDWEITCHYEGSHEEMTSGSIIKENLGKLIALTDKNGLFVSSEGIKLVGHERAKIFDSEGKIVREIEVGGKLE